MMIRELFKYQKELIAFANTKYGRDFLSQFGGKELKEDYEVVKVTPDSVHQKLDEDTCRAVFYPRSPYVKLLGEVLTMVDIASENNYKAEQKELIIPHFMGETKLLDGVLPKIYLASTTFNPDADPESTSVDGSVFRRSVNETWATIRAGAGTGQDGDSSAALWTFRAESSATTNQWAGLDRGIFLFDTSSLGSGSVIQSATCSLYYITPPSHSQDFSQGISLVASTPASNTALANADYSQTGTTKFASDISNTTVLANLNQYHDWTLNSTGLAAISKTGVTKFGSRCSGDADNSAPSWVSGKTDGGRNNSADEGSNKPKLVVTYTIAGSYSYFM